MFNSTDSNMLIFSFDIINIVNQSLHKCTIPSSILYVFLHLAVINMSQYVGCHSSDFLGSELPSPAVFDFVSSASASAPPTGVEVAGLFRDQIGGQDEEEQREEDTLAKQVVKTMV